MRSPQLEIDLESQKRSLTKESTRNKRSSKTVEENHQAFKRESAQHNTTAKIKDKRSGKRM